MTNYDDNYVQSFKRNEPFLSSSFEVQFNNADWKNLSFEQYNEQVIWEIISKMLEDDCNEGNTNQVHVVPEFKDCSQHFGLMRCFVDSNFVDSTFSPDSKYEVKTYIPLGSLTNNESTNKFVVSDSSADELNEILRDSPEWSMIQKTDPKSIENVMKNYTSTKNHYEWVRDFQNNYTWKNKGDGNLRSIQLQMSNITINVLTDKAKAKIRKLSFDTEYKTFLNTKPFKVKNNSYIYIIDEVVIADIMLFYELYPIMYDELSIPLEFSRNEFDAEEDKPKRFISKKLENIPLVFKYMDCEVDKKGNIIQVPNYIIRAVKKLWTTMFRSAQRLEALHDRHIAQFLSEDDHDLKLVEDTETEPETFVVHDEPPSSSDFRREFFQDLTDVGEDKVNDEIGDESGILDEVNAEVDEINDKKVRVKSE